ncbi:MAG: FAD:protein FMN transferase [Chlorobia bacterium]|nr:FAD:protein FMN transferase [Fimbriimonadaceae bacterium]
MGCLVGRCVTVSDASSSQEQLTRFTFTEYHMGIDARLTVYADTQSRAEKACRAAFDRIGALDWVMSDYRKDSELMKLCAEAGEPAVRVSPDLFKVLQKAEEVSRRSEGAFDVTVGPLVALWRASRKSGVLPNPAELEKARGLVGWEKVKLDDCGRTVQLAVSGMKLDLGGIAKGYACDEARKVLRRHGVTRALVEMGGDIVVSGPPPGKTGWTIRVPNAGDDEGPKDLDFANCAVSTSGDTEQFVIIGGVQYSHVVDPRTGQALTNRAQATIIAKEGLTSDPLSKVLTVLGEDKHASFLKKYRGVKSYLRVLKGTRE